MADEADPENVLAVKNVGTRRLIRLPPMVRHGAIAELSTVDLNFQRYLLEILRTR